MDKDHWPAHARRWALLGPPLRPSPEDVAIYERAILLHTANAVLRAPAKPGLATVLHTAPRALLLGVTPELATMAWPAGTTLTAVDRSQVMIDALHPGAGETIAAEWSAIPRPDAAFDVIVGDGCPSNLAYPDAYAAVGAELRRVLAPGGVVALRLFALPERTETLDDVARDLRAGRIAGFHALKWRIAMAVQPADRNVRVADILAGFEAIAPDRGALPWPAETVDTIDHYRGSEIVYSFPTAAEQVAALGLALVSTHTAGYELGDRCPIVVLSPPRPDRAAP